MAAKRPSSKKKSVRKKKVSAKPRAQAPARKRAAAGATSQVDQIQQVIDVMVASGAVEVELDDGKSRLRVRLKEDPHPTVLSAPPPVVAAAPIAAAVTSAPAEAAASFASGEVFKSPMVGTFYRAASPDAEAFAKEGDHVTEDSVICIIEAMKVMNEIKAEISGEVVEVLAQNGEPVDYGQPLFVIKV